MKSRKFVFTALLIGAMLLAACSGAGAPNDQTPAASGAASSGTGTPPAGGSVVATETMPAGGSPVETGTATTASATGTATTGAGTGNVPGTGSTSQFVLLSQLMAMPVNNQSGQQVGSVNGVVINAADSGSGSGGASITPAAPGTPAATSESTAVKPTDTPAAPVTGQGAGMAMGKIPLIGFVVLNQPAGATTSSLSITTETPAVTGTPEAGMENVTQTPAAGSSGSAGNMASGNQVLVPWQAFSFASASAVLSNGGSNGSSVSTTETPVANGTPTVAVGSGSSGNSMGSTSSGALILTVNDSVIAGAPAFDANAFASMIGSDVVQYWSNQGLSIPATGAQSSMGQAFLLQSPLSGLTINDNNGQSLGQVQDFVVNTQTGELVYAILTGGSTFGSKFYVVPLTVMSWQPGSTGASSSANMMGQIQANVPATAFSTAPSINSLSELDLRSAGWNSQIDSFWSTVK
jgi:sporulation protein YlmC with PRC-barrel domain